LNENQLTEDKLTEPEEKLWDDLKKEWRDENISDEELKKMDSAQNMIGWVRSLNPKGLRSRSSTDRSGFTNRIGFTTIRSSSHSNPVQEALDIIERRKRIEAHKNGKSIIGSM